MMCYSQLIAIAVKIDMHKGTVIKISVQNLGMINSGAK
jgi:ribosomal protein S8E